MPTPRDRDQPTDRDRSGRAERAGTSGGAAGRRPSRRAGVALAALAAFLPAVACTGDGDDRGEAAALSLGELRQATDECPVDLEAAVTAAGLSPDGVLAVDAYEGQERDPSTDRAIDRARGVMAECALPVAGIESTVEATIYASRKPGDSPLAEGYASPDAAALQVFAFYSGSFSLAIGSVTDRPFGPDGRPANPMDAIADDVIATDIGELVDLDLPVSDHPVALARIDVEDANAGALVVVGEGTVTQDQARAVAQELLDQL